MQVRCISTQLSIDQRHQLKIAGKSPEHQIVPGRNYLVLGITFSTPDEQLGGGIQYEILNDFGKCRGIPSLLFEVQDPRCSRYWIANHHDDGSLLLWPEEFYTEFFHDDLSEGNADSVEAFQRVVERMQAEFE